MDNNDKFEQQFKQNLHNTPLPAHSTNSGASASSKPLLVISIILAVVVLLETFALVITLSNYFGVFESGTAEEVTFDDETLLEEETAPEDNYDATE